MQLANLPTPEPWAIRKARVAAGLSQWEAGEAIGLSPSPHPRGGQTCKAWADYENGVRKIPALRWSAFLLATSQHPHLKCHEISTSDSSLICDGVRSAPGCACLACRLANPAMPGT